jgi:hypothetical protein
LGDKVGEKRRKPKRRLLMLESEKYEYVEIL